MIPTRDKGSQRVSAEESGQGEDHVREWQKFNLFSDFLFLIKFWYIYFFFGFFPNKDFVDDT